MENAICPVLVVPVASGVVNFKILMFSIRNIPNALEKYNFLRKIIKHKDSELVVHGKEVDNAIAYLTDSINYFDHQIKDDSVITSNLF